MMNDYQNQSLSTKREEMLKVRAAKFYFPREWEVPCSREHERDFEAQPRHNHVQDTD